MSNHTISFGFLNHGRGDMRVLAIVAVWLVVTSGCGSGQSALLPLASVEIIRGKDSAGATIELEKRGADLTTARVIDIVLGTGEAEIISDQEGQIEFTIDFPGGAAITYLGSVQPTVTSATPVLAGTWTQHAGGIFGEDAGTWQVAGLAIEGQ